MLALQSGLHNKRAINSMDLSYFNVKVQGTPYAMSINHLTNYGYCTKL